MILTITPSRIQFSSTRLNFKFKVLKKNEYTKILKKASGKFDSFHYRYHEELDEIKYKTFKALFYTLLSSLKTIKVYWTDTEFISIGLSEGKCIRSEGITAKILEKQTHEELSKLFFIIYDVGKVCNIHCPWCYAGKKIFEKIKLNVDVTKLGNILTKIILYACTKYIPKTSSVTLTFAIGGHGEPSCIQNLYDVVNDLFAVGERIYSYCRHLSFIEYAITITTVNLQELLSKLGSMLLKENLFVSVSYIPSSLRQYTKLNYTTDEFIDTVNDYIKLAEENYKRITIQFILSKKTLEEIIYILQHLKDIKCVSIFPLVYYPVNEQFKKYFASKDEVIPLIDKLIEEMAKLNKFYFDLDSLILDACTVKLMSRYDFCKQAHRMYRILRINAQRNTVKLVKPCPMGTYCHI